MKRRAVITGFGCITSLGENAEKTWSSMLNGNIGIKKLEKFDIDSYKCHFGGAIKDFSLKNINISGKNLMHYPNQLELFSVIQAFSNYEFFDSNDERNMNFSVNLGNQLINLDLETLEIILRVCSRDDGIDFTSLGTSIKQLPPLNGVKLLPTVPSHFIAKTHNLHGEGALNYCGEISSLLNVLLAAKEIENGFVDQIVVSAVFSPFTPHEFLWLSGQGLMRNTSSDDDPKELMFPFDKRHCGIIYGEGAGTLIIESEECAKRNGRKILAYINGGAVNMFPGNAYDELTEAGFKNNIFQTLHDSDLNPADLDLLFANACSYPNWDDAELQAIMDIWPEGKVSISCSKAYLGYPGCSSGIIDCILAVMSMSNHQYLPLINFESTGENRGDKLEKYRIPQPANEFNRCLINNAGLGGSYCSIVLEKVGKNE